MEAISSLSTSITIATIFTDDCGHPAHEANCRLLHHWLPSIPLFMVDSDSIVLPKLVFGNLTSIRDSNTATDEAAKNKSSANDDDRQSFDKKLLVGELRRILSQSTTAGRVYMIESEPISDLQLEIASKLENQIRINIQAARSGGVNIIDWSSLQSVLNSTTSSQISTHQDIIKSYSDNRSTVQKPTDRRRSYEFSTRSTFTAPTSTATNTISNGPTASTTGATVRPPRVSFDTSAKPDSYGQQKSSYSSIKTSVAVKAVQVPSQLAFIEQKMKLENLHSQSIHEHNVSDVLQYISTYFESLRHDPHISVNNADSTSINIIGDTFEVIQEVKCWVFSLLRSGVISSSVLLKYIAYLYFEYVSSSSSVSDSTSNKLPSIVFPITTGTADDSTNNNTTSSSVISNHYDTYILYCDDDKLQFNHSRIDHFLRIIIGDNHSVSSAPLSSINSLSTHTTIADSSSSAVILMICSLGRVIADGEWSRYLSVSQLSDSTIRSLFQSHAQLLTTVAQDKAKHANGSNKCRIIELGDVDIQWANLLPTKSIRELTRLEEILRVFNAAFRKVKATTISDTMTPSITTATTTATTAYSAYSIAKSMIENRFYPGHLMSQDNTEPLFHGLHTTLVHSGTVPLDILLDYYISYLMLRSATPEQGLKVAILEISTHAKSFVYEDALLIPYVLHRVAQYTLPGIYDIITTLDLTSLESFIAQTKVSTGGKASSVHDIHSSTVEVNSDQQARVLHSVTPMHPAIPQRVNQVSAGSYTNRTNTMSTSVSSSHSNVIAGKYPTALHTATRNDNDTVSNNSVSSTIAADFDISTRILAALRKRVEEAVGEIYVTKIKFAGQSL